MEITLEYKLAKIESVKVGELVHNTDFIKTIAMLIESSDEISGGRAAEIMEMLTHLLMCRKVCEENGLIKGILLEN